MIATMTSFASTAFSLQVRRSRSSKFCPKNAIFHGLRSLLWPTEEEARRQTFYWQSNSDSKLGTCHRKKIISGMDRAQESGKKKIAKQHSETITCKMQATKTTADRELCLKSEKRLSPRLSHNSSKEKTPTRIRVREDSCIFPAVSTVPIGSLPSPLRFQVSLHACIAL